MSGLHIPLLSADQQVRMLAGAYGAPRFWLEVLATDSHPLNISRALLVLAHCDLPAPLDLIRSRLGHADSRVRAWACTCLGRRGDGGSLDQLDHLTADPSPRVRCHARRALRALGAGPHHCGAPPAGAAGQLALVSEDSPIARRTLAEVLRRNGVNVAAAACEQETLRKARALRPSLILTDNQKHRDNTSGLRMTEALAADPALSETLLFMVSADPVEGLFLWNGGDAFVHKVTASLRRLERYLSEYLGAAPAA